MTNGKGKIRLQVKVLSSIFFLSLFGLLLSCQTVGRSNLTQELTMYCAAGLKPAVEQIAKAYQTEYGVKVNLQYGGSGTLLSNISIAKRGDLYLAADESYIEKAKQKGLVTETQPLVFLRPVIAVALGNPWKIEVLEDLKNVQIKLAFANPDAASIGRITKSILMKKNEWDNFSSFITVMKPTVNDLANDLKIGTIDAAIIWDAVANQYPEIDYIIPDGWAEYEQKTTVGILKFTENSQAALKFLRYLSASDKGLATFSALGYSPIDGGLWEEKTGSITHRE